MQVTTLGRPVAHPATPGHPSTLGRPGHLVGLSEAEALYARVRRGRGRGAHTPSDGGSDDMVSSSTPLVASYSTGSDDMATSMDTSILRDTSAMSVITGCDIVRIQINQKLQTINVFSTSNLHFTYLFCSLV